MTMRPRKQKLIMGTFLLMCSMSACDCDDDDRPPDEVYARTKPGIDFSEYQTFRIDDVDDDDLIDAGVDPDDIPDDIRYNIDIANDQARLELEDRGLTMVDDDEEADLVIASAGKTEDQDAIVWECVPGYWWGYWGAYWDSCAWLEPEYVEWTVGTVAVGVADLEMEEGVFAGLLQGIADGDDTEDRIRDGVHEMFKEWPEQ